METGRATRIQRIENLGDTWPVSGLTFLDFILTYPVAGTGRFWETGTNGGVLNAAICVAVRHRTLLALRKERKTVLSAKAKPMVSGRA